MTGEVRHQKGQGRSIPAPGLPFCGKSDLRCGWGSPLAKLVCGAVELKCRRCKHTRRIPLSAC